MTKPSIIEKHISPHGRITAVSMMKDEGPFLLEWIAHHLAVGFTDIVVYTNDCTDGTDDMLVRLEELGLAHHRVNKIPKDRRPQPSAIKHAQDEPIVRDSDWVMVFDADEFLCIKTGDGTIDHLITSGGDANGIVVTWRVYGSAGVIDWSREPVTEQFVQAAPENWNKGWGVKTLFKFDHEYWKLGIHRPSIKRKHLDTPFPDTVKWVNGSGHPMEDYFKFRGWRSIRRTVGYGLAQMNHYAVKSVDSYALRTLRGNVNLKKDKYNADYWALQDRNEVLDESALNHQAKRAAIMAGLLKDPVLLRLHNAAVDAAEARLAEFKKTEEYQELKAGLVEASKIPISDVQAKPPKARDAEKIAALMSGVERQSNARQKSERGVQNLWRAGLSGLGTSELYQPAPQRSAAEAAYAENHDISLPVDVGIFSERAAALIADGKFDRRNARQITQLVAPNDRLLEIGGGIGFISAVVAKTYPASTVMVQDEREALISVARAIAAAQKFGERFQVSSGATALQSLIGDFKPTVLRISDSSLEGAALTSEVLETVRLVIWVHERQLANPKDANAALAWLQEAGFSMIAEKSTDLSTVYVRNN